MKWKILAAALAVLFVGSNVWHLYRVIDQGVTDMYRDQVAYELANQVVATAKLADVFVRNKTQAQAVILLRQVFPGDDPFVKEGAVNSTWVSLKLTSAQRVSGVDVDEAKLFVDSYAHDAQ